MRHRHNPDGSLTELTDLHACTACGGPFQRGLMVLSWSNCSCTPGSRGHRIACCMRGTCRAFTYSPPCSRKDQHHPLEGHDHWGTVQHGPVLDLGDG